MEKLEKLEQLHAVWLSYCICMMSWSEDLHGGVDTKMDVARVRKILNKRGSK